MTSNEALTSINLKKLLSKAKKQCDKIKEDARLVWTVVEEVGVFTKIMLYITIHTHSTEIILI